VTITEEYLTGVVAQARAMPGKLNGILRLHFCVWTDADTAWMTRELLEPCIADFDIEQHHDKQITVGLDLSQNRDITALASVVKTGEVDVEVRRNGKKELVRKPTFDAWVEAWTPKDTMAARELADKLPYAKWVKDGHLHAPNGASISYLHVAQTLAEYDRDFDIEMVAYDRFAFRRFEEDVQQLGLDIEFVEHPQGGMKKGKASEAMKAAAKNEGRDPEGLWMPGSLRMLEEAILEGRIRLKRSPVLISAMMSAVTDEDKWDNRWLAKQRSVNKIDAAVALCMAIGAANATVSTPQFEMMII
jgi:phage terminase large subunit-like protein